MTINHTGPMQNQSSNGPEPPQSGGSHFVICPKCLSAYPGAIRQTLYECHACHHEWQAPVNSLGDLFFADIQEISVSLVDISGEEFPLNTFPTIIGRNTDFKALQSNLSISRQHCSIGFDDGKCCFYVRPFKTGGGTYLNGNLLKPEEDYPLFPGDSLVLSGVVLQLKCVLKTEIEITEPNPKKAFEKEIYLDPRSAQMILMPTLEFADVNSASLKNTVAYFSYNSTKKQWSVWALNRNKIQINGDIFIEKQLSGGENVTIEGNCFVFDATDNKLVPTEREKGVDIVLQNLKAGYGDKVVLGDITCHLPKGKLTAILGQSGCGKSTLIKVLSGQKKIMSGTISFNDNAQDYSTWAENHLALVPQDDVVHSELSVKQCIEYAADIRLGRKSNSKLRKAMVERVLLGAGLKDYENSFISNLSGGQRKRVNIAVELTGNPEVLLLDEPTTGLDYATEKQIIAGLRQLSRQGKTIVFVTHSLATIEAADHVVVLKSTRYGARVASEGSPEDVQKSIGIESWEELYSSLSQSAPSNDLPVVEKTTRWRFFQGIPLFSRYLMIWLNYPISSIALLFGLPLLLGLMIRLAVSIDAPMGVDRLIFGLVAMFWLGMNQTVREIVKEKTIFIQEQSHHISSFSYLMPKIMFFAIVAIPQAFLMSAPILWLNVDPEEYFLKFNQLTCSFISVFPMMWLAGFIGCVLGLFFSALSLFIKQKGEIAAVLFAVIATLPQFLFSAKVLPEGLAKPLHSEHFYTFICWHEHAPVAEFLSFFTFSRYLFLPLDAISSGLSNKVITKAFVFNCGILTMSTLIMIILTWLTLELYTIWHSNE